MKAKLVQEFLNEGQNPPVMNIKQIEQILMKDLKNKNSGKKRKPIMFIIKPEIYKKLNDSRDLRQIKTSSIEYKSDEGIMAPNIIAMKPDGRQYKRWIDTYGFGQGQPMLIITDNLKKIPANIAKQCDVAIIGGK